MHPSPRKKKKRPEIDVMRFLVRADPKLLRSAFPEFSEDDLQPVFADLPSFDTILAVNCVLSPPRPLAPKPNFSTSSKKRVKCLAWRRQHGFALFHPGDLVYLERTSDLGEALERMVYTLSDYHQCAGEGDAEHEPKKNGAEVLGQQRLRKHGAVSGDGIVVRPKIARTVRE